MRLARKINIEIGSRFSYLIVESFSGYGKSRDKEWKCLCDCGNTVIVTSSNLDRSKVKSCGCMRRTFQKDGVTTHGKSYTSTYSCWKAMKARCNNPNTKYYSYYGGSGVKVCDRWMESFENFLEDMGERPEGTSINRVNAAKLYSKDTCEWATRSLQGFDQKVRSTNTSGRTGVCKKSNGKWFSQIRLDYKNTYLGSFNSYEEAVKAREDAELKYYGFIKG